MTLPSGLGVVGSAVERVCGDQEITGIQFLLEQRGLYPRHRKGLIGLHAARFRSGFAPAVVAVVGLGAPYLSPCSACHQALARYPLGATLGSGVEDDQRSNARLMDSSTMAS